MDAAPGCRLQRRRLLSQHIDGVARAGSAGTKSGSRARSLVLLTMLAPVVENRTVRGSARARRRSELANRRHTKRVVERRRLRHGQLSSPWRSGRRFANFQRQRGPAVPRESMFCTDTPRPYIRLSPDVVCHLERFCHLKPFCHLVSPRRGATTRPPTHPPRVGGGGGSTPRPSATLASPAATPCPTHCIPPTPNYFIYIYTTVKRTRYSILSFFCKRESRVSRLQSSCEMCSF